MHSLGAILRSYRWLRTVARNHSSNGVNQGIRKAPQTDTHQYLYTDRRGLQVCVFKTRFCSEDSRSACKKTTPRLGDVTVTWRRHRCGTGSHYCTPGLRQERFSLSVTGGSSFATRCRLTRGQYGGRKQHTSRGTDQWALGQSSGRWMSARERRNKGR
ncbi:hypothetical protein Bbelb_042280 [Branchiostoma belcheri]|nr:hypothetical protein Bbelb_042280 [Branchiostoma belcheri]